jgi:hypothetical protein
VAGGGQLKRLMRALEDLRSASSPTARLDAARRIREAADKLEQVQVDAARSAGATWSDIGAVYGLSKQGAQQRFFKGRARPR